MNNGIEDQNYNYTFGILTAMAIIFVVAGHLNYDIFTIEGFFPYYSFHMPLFVFISGYFYKETYEKNIRKFLVKKIKRLVLPYFLWNLFYGVLVMILERFGFTIGDKLNFYTFFIQPFIDGHQFYFNLASWFLLALFIVEVVYLLEHKMICFVLDNELLRTCILLAISIIMGLVGIQMANSGYDYSGWLIFVRTLFFIPFYCIGNIYNRILEKRDVIDSYVYFAILIGGGYFLS